MGISGELTRRDLDGIYIRVRVDGEWMNRCLTDMYWEDVKVWLDERWSQPDTTPERKLANLEQVARHLHSRLRELGDSLDIFAGDREQENQ